MADIRAAHGDPTWTAVLAMEKRRVALLRVEGSERATYLVTLPIAMSELVHDQGGVQIDRRAEN